MNRRVRPSKKARKIAKRETFVPDLCHSESRLAIEYDSNAEHLTSRQIAKDSSKRLALEADGYKVISVTTRQLCDRSEMRSVAHEAGSRMSRRIQIRAKSFGNAQRKLYATGWSLKAYHRREWLKGEVSEGGLKECVQNSESGLDIVSGTDLPGIERRLSRGVLVERDRGDLLAANRDGLSVSGGDDLRSGTRIARRCLVLCKMPHFS